MTVKTSAKATIKVQRGPQSWASIYVFLGFLLTIEGNILALVQLDRVWGLSLYPLISDFITGATTL
jgi:hypothetical protein